MVTSYEAQREANIAANKAILASLGLEIPATTKTPSRQSTQTKSTKVSKPVAIVNDNESTTNRRRSTRLTSSARKSLREEYLEIDSDDNHNSKTDDEDKYCGSDEGLAISEGGYIKAKETGFLRSIKGGRSVLKFNGGEERKGCAYYGAPDVPVGTWWEMRAMVSRDGVHGPWVAGIHGHPTKGAYSVALSGGYEDDIDEGFRFTYTGEGGRSLKGTKSNPKNLRTGPQTKDQTLTRGNAALMTSAENKVPVRVLRGYKLRGKWAPVSGYRYDGLYEVCKGWVTTGASGFKVYKFAFKRIDGQPPINVKAGPQKEKPESEVEADAEDTLEAAAEEGNFVGTLSEEQTDEGLTGNAVEVQADGVLTETLVHDRDKAVDDIVVMETVGAEGNTRITRKVGYTRKRKVDEASIVEGKVVLETKSQRTSKRQRNSKV